MFQVYDIDNDELYNYSDDDNDAGYGSSTREMQLHMYEDDDSSEDIETQLTSLRRRSKNKRRSNTTAATTSTSNTTEVTQSPHQSTPRHTVQFGTVECKTYPVTLSACTMPRSGGPPIGIDYNEEPITTLSCTIDTYESLYPNRKKEKQLRLSTTERCNMLLSLTPGDEVYDQNINNMTSSLHHKLSIQPTSSYSPPSPPRVKKYSSFSSFSFNRPQSPTQSSKEKRQPWINQDYMKSRAAGFKRKRSRVTDAVLSLLRMSPKRARKERFGTF